MADTVLTEPTESARGSMRVAVAVGVAVAVAIALAALGVTVWPTPYREFALRRAPARILAARQQRLTGRVDVLTAAGWFPLERRIEPQIERQTTTRATVAAPPAPRDTKPADSVSDPLDGYRIDWRGGVPSPDTLLRLRIAPSGRP
jgi:hypothetical protein